MGRTFYREGGRDRDKRDGAEKDGEVFRGHGFNAADTKA